MLRKRILKNLRMLVLVMLGVILGTGIGGLYYLNQSGINEQWREKITAELERLGIYADFKVLRYEPSQGLVAKHVRIYSDENRTETVATLKNLIIEVDKTKLMRGKFRANNVSLEDVEVSFPIDPADPDGPRVMIHDMNGELFLPDKNTIEARSVSGMVAGIELHLEAHLWSKHLAAKRHSTPQQDQQRISRIKFVAKCVQELNRWSWPQGHPPRLKIYVEGNVDEPNSGHLEFALNAKELERDGVTLKNIHLSGDYNNKIVTLDRISLNDESGRILARADFQQNTKKARFEITESTLHLQRLMRKILGLRPLHQVTFSTPPVISGTGTLELDQNLSPQIQLTGKALAQNFTYAGTRIESLQTDISLQGKDLFLTNTVATHREGEIRGKFLLKDGLIRYQALSTLPASAYTPFVIHPVAQKYFNACEFSPESRIQVSSQGTVNPQTSAKYWDLKGELTLSNFIHRGVPIKKFNTLYHFTKEQSTFKQIMINFDYRDYPLRKQYGGPLSSKVEADLVTLDHLDRMVHIERFQTTAWPAPVIRLFAPKAAQHCELYRFWRPPNLVAQGSFDMNKDQKRTDFTVNVRVPGSTHYAFLGEDLTLKRLRGDVRITHNQVDVSKLAFQTFQGPCKGNLTVQLKQQAYQGGLQWSRLHLKDLGALYHFKNADQGLLTGRLDYSGQGKDIRQFNGKGSIGLERGNLFSIPMMGPLSPLIGTVLGDKNPTNEQAENASCTFAVRKGVVYSDNFLANTRSLTFTGEGKVDLHQKSIDLLVRMNARGLFSIISLPLKPFMGLFQFQGSGKLSSPEWKTSIFTAPKRGKKDPIFRRPPKARVINE